MHVGGIRKLLYVFASVWEIISSLKLVDYLPYRRITIQSYNLHFYNDFAAIPLIYAVSTMI